MLRDFTPHFIVSYNLGSQHWFPKCQSILLSTEVANQFLDANHLEDSTKAISRSDIKFSEKDIASLEYLSGYCFRTVYARLRSSLKHTSLHSQQCMSVLKAGKCHSDAEMPVQRLVDAGDRGGLWKVDERVQAIFRVCEMEFLIFSFGFHTKIVILFFKRKYPSPSSLTKFPGETSSRQHIHSKPWKVGTHHSLNMEHNATTI